VIVVTFGGFLILAGLLNYLMRAENRARAGLRLALGAGLAVLLFAGSHLEEKREDLELAHVLETGTKAERIQVLAQVAAQPERWPEIAPLAGALLAKGEIEVRLNLLDLIAKLRPAGSLAGVHALLTDPDDAIREHALSTVRALADPSSKEPLL